MTDNHIARAKAAAERAANSNKTAERESLALLAIADALIALVEAGNGRGKCHNTSKVVDKHGQARFVCSVCGAWLHSRMLWNPEYPNGDSPFVKDCKLNFCPNCGAEVVEL